MLAFLRNIVVWPRVLVLAGLTPEVSLGQIRSVWGMSLENGSPAAFDDVFLGRSAEHATSDDRPAYTLADLGHAGRGLRVLRWTLIASRPNGLTPPQSPPHAGGKRAIDREAVHAHAGERQTDTIWNHMEALCAAWDAAGRAGAGRGRVSFRVEQIRELTPRGEVRMADAPHGPWPLSEARWPLSGEPATTPCRLEFPAGLHLRYIRDGKKMFAEEATWDHLINNAYNRLHAWLPQTAYPRLDQMRDECLEVSAQYPLIATMAPGTVPGWSRRQENETGNGHKKYRVLKGNIDFPNGPGPAWPLLLASHWLSLGRHFTEGIGCFRITAG